MTGDAQPTPPTTESLVTSTTMLLIAAGRVAQRRLEEALRGRGITLRHVGALGHVARDPDLSYSDLARRAGVTVQSMHSTIATLVDLDAIAVETPEPGRPARLRLTDRGRELLRTAGTIAHNLDTTLPLGELDDRALRAALLQIARPPGP
ncbi:MAG TPA: MarR family winged helix-turn-helix transcriptional regulator [Pseudonocardia sp.]